ncbi:hypothetical protein [Pararhodospirillum oryzae]|nr:hypothetical protein [Pararhodospirillum oryzae]
MTHHNAFIIEVAGRSAGIVVAERGGFTFFASDWTFKDMDRRIYRRVDHAERAARRVLAARGAPA